MALPDSAACVEHARDRFSGRRPPREGESGLKKRAAASRRTQLQRAVGAGLVTKAVHPFALFCKEKKLARGKASAEWGRLNVTRLRRSTTSCGLAEVLPRSDRLPSRQGFVFGIPDAGLEYLGVSCQV